MPRILARPGELAKKESFITRDAVEDEVRYAIRGADRPSSISVYGQMRVGKTSLVQYIANEWREEGSLDPDALNPTERVVVFVDCSRFGGNQEGRLVGPQIMALIVNDIYQDLQSRGFAFPTRFDDFYREFREAVRAGAAASEIESLARSLVQTIVDPNRVGRDNAVQVLIILDEADELKGRFDSALGSLPEWMAGADGHPVPVVIISRRECSQIEDEGEEAPGSGWCRSFARNITVGMFSHRSRRTMIEVALEDLDRRARRSGPRRGSDDRIARIEAVLDRTCRNHPYLVNHFLDALLMTTEDFEAGVRAGLARVRQEELVLFDRLVRRFEGDGILPDLLAVLFIPGAAVRPAILSLIIQSYQLARVDEGMETVAMSPDFASYLRYQLRAHLVERTPEYDKLLDELFSLVRSLAGPDLEGCPAGLRQRIDEKFREEAERQRDLFGGRRDWCSVMLVTEAVEALEELLAARVEMRPDVIEKLQLLDRLSQDIVQVVRTVPLGALLERMGSHGNSTRAEESILSLIEMDEVRLRDGVAAVQQIREELALA